MTHRRTAFAFALAGLFVSSSAGALTITMDPAAPVPIGQAQTFRAKVTDAVGSVTIRWNFGDGERTDPIPDLSVSHTYAAVGHYSVIALATDDLETKSATFVQTAHFPLTATPPRNSSSILVDAAHHQVWNVNPDSDSVSVSDSMGLAKVREIAVGDEPHSLAQAPDGTIWVANQMSDEIAVIDPGKFAVTSRITLPYASQPLSVVFGAKGTAYVSLFATGKLVEIEVGTHKVTREVALGPTPFGISVASDGRIFVTRFISPQNEGQVWVVSPDSFTLKNTIHLAEDMGPDSESRGRGIPNYVSSMIISPDGTQAWVTTKKDDVERGPQRDGNASNSDNFVRALVCSVDMKTETETVARRMDIDNRSQPFSVAFTPVGDYAYILLMSSNWIGIYDAYSTLQLGGIKDIGNAPDGLVLSDGRLFVNAFLSREVIAYDMGPSIASIDQSAPPPLARIGTIDHEPLPPDVLLGKKVFFNAADPRMSDVGYMSCVTCHFGGMSDGRIWDFTTRGEGLRNTKSLLGVRGTGEGRVHWSANFDEIQDFERDIRESFGGSGFMPEAEFATHKGLNGAYDPFSKPAAGACKELDGLAAYFKTFDKTPRSPFRNSDGSFTQDALEGRKIFERAECPSCHMPDKDFTDSSLGMLHDVGTILPTSGSRLGGKLEGTDTPTIKGVWQSAPYLHDGRAATLTEIFTKFLTDNQMGMTKGLTSKELSQLERYMLELDDVPETVRPPEPPPHRDEPRGIFSCGLRPFSGSSAEASWFAWLGAIALVFARRRRLTGGVIGNKNSNRWLP
jgi:DNA-binding beta-propeller fold protein YncE